jgi:hypothetical protein
MSDESQSQKRRFATENTEFTEKNPEPEPGFSSVFSVFSVLSVADPVLSIFEMASSDE